MWVKRLEILSAGDPVHPAKDGSVCLNITGARYLVTQESSVPKATKLLPTGQLSSGMGVTVC